METVATLIVIFAAIASAIYKDRVFQKRLEKIDIVQANLKTINSRLNDVLRDKYENQVHKLDSEKLEEKKIAKNLNQAATLKLLSIAFTKELECEYPSPGEVQFSRYGFPMKKHTKSMRTLGDSEYFYYASDSCNTQYA